jgi:hypothetical protein
VSRRDIPRGEADLDTGEPARRQVAPGKISSTSLLGNPDAPRSPVSPGKRTLTMALAQVGIARGSQAPTMGPEPQVGESKTAELQKPGTGQGPGFGSPIPPLTDLQPDDEAVATPSPGTAAAMVESLGPGRALDTAPARRMGESGCTRIAPDGTVEVGIPDPANALPD